MHHVSCLSVYETHFRCSNQWTSRDAMNRLCGDMLNLIHGSGSAPYGPNRVAHNLGPCYARGHSMMIRQIIEQCHIENGDENVNEREADRE